MIAIVSSTATQTLDDGRSLHQWPSIQVQYWVGLQKVQHKIQHALYKRRDSGRSSSSHFPTAMLEQMKERLHNIAQDMYILDRSCGEEFVSSSLAQAQRSAPKKRRRAQRKRVMLVKQACSDNIEETISSTDDLAPQRKRARVNKEAPPSSNIHITSNASFHLHITTSHSCNSTSHGTILHGYGTVSWSVHNSLWLEANKTNTREHGGCAGTRVGEAQNPGPATHDRDWTVTEQPNAAHRRINGAGDSAPSSQDSVTRGSSEPAHLGFLCSTSGSASPATVDNEEFQKTATTEPTAQRVLSLCTVRSRSRRSQSIHRRRSRAAHWAKTRRTAAPSQIALGNCAVSTVQPCVVCGTIRSKRCNRCGFCNSNTPLREHRVVSGQTTARASECSGQLCGRRPATPSELAARFRTAPSRTSP